MPSSIEELLKTPSRAAWRELCHLWTALPVEMLRLAEWEAALASWPDAWRVAAPGWLPVASLGRAWPMPGREAWTSPLLRLARALDFAEGRAIAPSDRVLDALCQVDLAHITHVRHAELAPFLEPSERILARLLKAGRYDSVTHLAIEWPTLDELQAIARLPALRELKLAGTPYPSRPSHAAPEAFGEVLSGSATLVSLDTQNEQVWTSVRASALFVRLTRGRLSYLSQDIPEREPITREATRVSSFARRSERVTAFHASPREDQSALNVVFVDSEPRPLPADTRWLKVSASRKITPKIAAAWAREGLAELPLELAEIDLDKGFPLPTPVRPHHLVMVKPTVASSILAEGAQVRGLEFRAPSGPLWSEREILDVLEVITTPLELLVLEGTQLDSAALASLLAHPRLTRLQALCVNEQVMLKEGRKFVSRPVVPLGPEVMQVLAGLSELRWLQLMNFEATGPEVFAGLRLPSLFGLELDVRGARTLGEVMGLLTPEMERLVLHNLLSVQRREDELLHLGAAPHLALVMLGGLRRVEDDAESLDYAVGGVLRDSVGYESRPWLDEPV